MKTNELMLGDWLLAVDREGSDDVPNGLETTYPIQVDAIYGDTLLDHYGCERGEGDFRELPMTEELLQEHFPTDEELAWWPQTTVSGKPWDFHFEYARGRDFQCAVDLRYVHDLQHFLRMCGIDKEITVKTEE